MITFRPVAAEVVGNEPEFMGHAEGERAGGDDENGRRGRGADQFSRTARRLGKARSKVACGDSLGCTPVNVDGMIAVRGREFQMSRGLEPPPCSFTSWLVATPVTSTP